MYVFEYLYQMFCNRRNNYDILYYAVLDKVVKIILKYCLHLIQIQINRQKKKK